MKRKTIALPWPSRETKGKGCRETEKLPQEMSQECSWSRMKEVHNPERKVKGNTQQAAVTRERGSGGDIRHILKRGTFRKAWRRLGNYFRQRACIDQTDENKQLTQKNLMQGHRTVSPKGWGEHGSEGSGVVGRAGGGASLSLFRLHRSQLTGSGSHWSIPSSSRHSLEIDGGGTDWTQGKPPQAPYIREIEQERPGIEVWWCDWATYKVLQRKRRGALLHSSVTSLLLTKAQERFRLNLRSLLSEAQMICPDIWPGSLPVSQILIMPPCISLLWSHLKLLPHLQACTWNLLLPVILFTHMQI